MMYPYEQQSGSPHENLEDRKRRHPDTCLLCLDGFHCIALAEGLLCDCPCHGVEVRKRMEDISRAEARRRRLKELEEEQRRSILKELKPPQLPSYGKMFLAMIISGAVGAGVIWMVVKALGGLEKIWKGGLAG